MSILVNAETRVCVQGITGRIGSTQTEHMLREGTKIVSGVTPGKGGMTVAGVPVFDSMSEAQAHTQANAAVVFVPPSAAEPACNEAIAAGIPLIVLITEGVPVHSTMRIRARAEKVGARLIGPTTPGVIVPGCQKLGIMPARLFTPGSVGVISRSGTLSYEISGELSAAGLGQSTVVGIGADPVVGTDIQTLLQLFNDDPDTAAVILVGEVGGNQEERAAEFVAETMQKPVVAYVAGHTVPLGVRMGHAGAIVAGGTGSAADKIKTFERAGVHVAKQPSQVVDLVQEILDKQTGGSDGKKKRTSKSLD
ncbi:MAG: succinate--CoA ligase subunit alpha [Candidatus Latescibacteria bacterium]|jgi:succinyl-CoA synthetase alpha subunit|nr:succinate--CoA ligase subunit alpha [Candidatus Latescibacterota bacterium]